MPPTASLLAATHPPCQQVRRRAPGGQAAADGTEQYESVWIAVSGLAPWSGPVLGGTLVTVSGAGFAASMRLVRCRFGWGELVGASVHSAGEARCVSPPHAATGWVGIELVSLDEVVGGGSFFYEARAYVSLVLPLLGPVEGGTRLTVLGSHFRESSSLACRFGIGENGGFSVAARLLSSSQLECASPAVAGASARSVEVSFNGQQFSTGGAAYTYAQAVAVSSVWPVQGSAEGGTRFSPYRNFCNFLPKIVFLSGNSIFSFLLNQLAIMES